jgi:hypothetical protein
MKKIPVFLKTFLISKSVFILIFNFLFLFFFTAHCFSAPELSVKIDKNKVLTEEPFSLVLEIFWQGTADDFIIVPPAPSFPEKIEQISSSFSSSTTEQSYHLTYTYMLQPAEAGEYSILPIEIKYWTKGDDQESTLLTDEIFLEVKNFSYISRPVMWVVLSVFGIIVVAVFYFFIRDRRRLKNKKGGSDEGLLDKEDLLKTYDACRRYKTEGNYTGFYHAAIEVLNKTTRDEGVIIDDLKKVCEKVEFGSYCPPSEEIELVFRRITKIMEKTFSDRKELEFEYKKYCK